jgi:lipopolysaccharide biosynthesis glycosyltransferase
MKKTAIVTGGSKNDAPAMATLVINIKATNPDLADEIVILHDGISRKDQRIINGIFPTRFIKYSFPGDTSGFNKTITDYFTAMVFCKYECFRLLSEYRTVIWMDYDLVVCGDLSSFLDSCPASARIMTSYVSVAQSFHDSISSVDMSSFAMDDCAIALPWFVLHDSFPGYQECYEWCVKKTIEYGEHLYLPEQAIVSLMLQEFHIDTAPIINVPDAHPLHSTAEEVEAAKILHTYGQPKFWNGLNNAQWDDNYRTWLELGGSRFKPSLPLYRKLLRIIKQRYFRHGSRNIANV